MNDRMGLRLLVVQVLIVSMFVALFGRLFYLQVAAGSKYQLAAEDNQSREILTASIRGMILDDMGRPLAKNATALVVTVDSTVIGAQPDQGRGTLKKLSSLIKVSESELWSRTRICGREDAVADMNERMAAYKSALAAGRKPSEPRKLCWNGSPYQPIPVTRDADPEMALRIVERNDLYPGVSAAPQGFRLYPSPQDALSTHVLGYTGLVSSEELKANSGLRQSEVIGKAGLEKQYDRYLRGNPGIKKVIVDRTGRVKRSFIEQNASSGAHLITSIDAGVQAAAEKALAGAVARGVGLQGRGRADGGAAIVMDIKTGRIIALASYPTYDPNIWLDGLTNDQAESLFSPDKNSPALNRAIQGQFAPASTFKVVSIGAATTAGLRLNANYNCPANVKVGTRTFNNFESKSAGLISMRQAIAISCDTVWYQIAYDMWVRDGGLYPKNPKDFFFNAAHGFGLGKKTGVDLPSEVSGRIPDRAWKKAYWDQTKNFYCNYEKRAKPAQKTAFLLALAKENCVDGFRVRAGDAVNFSIGQGDTTATLMQMVRIYSAIANNGTYFKPTIARAIVSPDGKLLKEFKPQEAGKLPLDGAALKFLQAALRDVVTGGTARGAFAGTPVAVSGKTGTGEVYGRNANGTAKGNTSWFLSYGPTEKPLYAIGMVVSQGGFGASTSGVGVRQIWDAIYGVRGGKIVPEAALLPNGPPQSLPKITSSGQVKP